MPSRSKRRIRINFQVRQKVRIIVVEKHRSLNFVESVYTKRQRWTFEIKALRCPTSWTASVWKLEHDGAMSKR